MSPAAHSSPATRSPFEPNVSFMRNSGIEANVSMSYLQTLSVSVRIWQRDRMVGRSEPGWPVVRMNRQLRGGSSSVFRNAFCAFSFMVSHSWMMPIFQPPGAELLRWNMASKLRSVSGSESSFPITIWRDFEVGASRKRSG